ncbi:hypothetical protein IV203_030387 [Nitzschia inconspicua]|uniref:Uncharacterized protein n=1 Tax=Nitzschia inconspicua TaxID=303405 RepID=A0A9K3LV92_9STRA|nr:hypothetical protein IV203_030387 [Nitzschia inconspicua]
MAAPTHPFGQIKSKRKRRHPKLIVAPIPSLKLFLRQPKYSSSRLHSASFCDGSPFRFLSSSAHHTQHCICGNVHPHDRGFAFAVRGIPNSIATDIAFVEMSIRMTADSHLPSVGYQIRLQRILNECFVILMMLLLEGMLVFVMRTYLEIDESYTKALDWITAISAFGHNMSTVSAYYRSKRNARNQLDYGFNTEKERKKSL